MTTTKPAKPAKPASKKQQAAEERARVRAELLKLCPVGTTVYTVLRHVSTSGMQRRIDCYIIRDNEPWCISYYVGLTLGYKRHPKYDGLVVNGGGMDMGYHLVDCLSQSLHGTWYKFNHRWI